MEILMTNKKSAHKSTIEIFWKFVQDNPELVASIAMELAALAAVALKKLKQTDKTFYGAKKKSSASARQQADHGLTNILKLLPTPKIQKRARPKRNTRSTKQAA
jgi:hypothetical protein